MLQGGVPDNAVESVALVPEHIVEPPLRTAVLDGITVTTADPSKLSLKAVHPVLSLNESNV